MRTRARRPLLLTLVSGLLLAVGLAASAIQAAPAEHRGNKPDRVKTSSDKYKAKLDEKLQQKVEDGSNEKVYVFVTVTGNAASVEAKLDDGESAQANGDAIVVGQTTVQQLQKLASIRTVVSVGLIEFKKTGEPLGVPDPLLHQPASKAKLNDALKGLYKREVPYSRAPKLKGSNFEKLKKLGVLDAKTHDFAGAWKAGYTGEGVTVGVLDGGTDWGHPDLIGTWQTWSGATSGATVDAGWNGWPKAFDPYGTLQWLAAPAQVDQGLSWYTSTAAATCPPAPARRSDDDDDDEDDRRRQCRVSFATRTGPSRNFAAPNGTVTHEYRFPQRWTKSGTVRLGSHPDDHLLQLFGERPAFLVVDAKTAGVYDTVYVDLDADFNFGDEKPVTKESPVSYRDMDGNGYTDISGGLLYFISDGATRIPGGLTSFLGPGTPKPPPGELLAWTGDFDPAIGGHGTLTASNIVGQGVINGKVPTFRDLPGNHRVPGAVIGGSPHAKLAPFGDIYFSFSFSTQLGYFLSVGRGIDITSNSYGESATDNDGFDPASQEADIWHDGARTTPLFSTGNGAPGFGTTAPPSPSAGIAVGASTQFGGTGWDSIVRLSQIPDNDVMVWSNRGPGATGAVGVDVVADGAFSSGDITLNAVLDGRYAWETWGGTSRSAPVAASATALVYQAYKATHGGAVPAGFYSTAKDILKSSSQDLGYSSYIQGAGSVDAARAVKGAAGTGPKVSPSEWRPGSYRGTEYPVFTHVLAPGATDTQTFTIAGSGSWTLSDRVMRRVDTETLDFSSADMANESVSNFNAPDYLMDLTERVEAHPDADLMVIRANFPHDQFDPNADYTADQAWRLLTYNWTDVDRDRSLWRDRDGDGVVDHVDKSTSSNIDGFLDIDFRRSEIDEGEYVRFMYHRAGANSLMSFVRDPEERMADGLFLGLQHSTRDPAIPVTDFTIQIDWYENSDWSWVTTPASATGSFDAAIQVPAGTPYGMYDGAIVLAQGEQSMVVPVSVAVAAVVPQDGTGAITGSIEFGGDAVATAQADLLYNNGSVFGANDWTWRAESGDWRFFFLDVGTAPPPGTLFLTDTTWDDAAPFTDLDTLVFGRSANEYQLAGPGPFGAPYIIDTVGASPNTNVGAGVWTFNTATGGAHEIVAAPAQEGLHALVQHQVGWDGGEFHVPFRTAIGSASVTPSSVDISTAADSGTFDVTFQSSVDLDGLSAEAFGLSQPVVSSETLAQDNQNDPSTASNKTNVTLAHASRLTVATSSPDAGASDLDLYVVYDANNNGTFALDEIVAASAGGTSLESVELIRPPDGNYQIWLHGFSITGTPNVQLLVDAVQGNDLTVTGVPAGSVPAGTPVVLTVSFAKTMTAGQSYFGELQLGPATAPSALTVPIKITRTP
ncbi:MAG TPA: S8 family serine peptidase [Gaiella sp.]|jgi:hypothetical protein